MSQTEALNIRILGKDYRVSCDAKEKEDLLASAEYLNEKLDEIKQSGNIIGSERIAVMTALNLCHDILHNKNLLADHENLNKRINSLSQQISDTIKLPKT